MVERLLQKEANVNAAPAEENGKTALQATAEAVVIERLLQMLFLEEQHFRQQQRADT